MKLECDPDEYLRVAKDKVAGLQLPNTRHDDVYDWLGNALAPTADDSPVSLRERMDLADDLFFSDRYDANLDASPKCILDQQRAVRIGHRVLVDVVTRTHARDLIAS